jgi:hypothetical protein
MVKMVTKFKCEICKSEYVDYLDASNCERKGIEEPKLSVGQELHFDQKVTGFELYHRKTYRVRDIYINGHNCWYQVDEYNSDSERFECYGKIIDGNEALNSYVLE